MIRECHNVYFIQSVEERTNELFSTRYSVEEEGPKVVLSWKEEVFNRAVPVPGCHVFKVVQVIGPRSHDNDERSNVPIANFPAPKLPGLPIYTQVFNSNDVTPFHPVPLWSVYAVLHDGVRRIRPTHAVRRFPSLPSRCVPSTGEKTCITLYELVLPCGRPLTLFNRFRLAGQCSFASSESEPKKKEGPILLVLHSSLIAVPTFPFRCLVDIPTTM